MRKIVAFIMLFQIMHCSNNNDNDYFIENDKGKSLVKMNNLLNKYYSKKDWGNVYKLFIKSKEIGLLKNLYEEDAFRSGHNEVYFSLIIDVKMISYKITEDKAETKNLIEGKTILNPFKTFKDTTYHYWCFIKGKWYLYDCDRRK